MTTIKQIKQHFKDKGYVPRHSFNGLKYACNKLCKQEGINGFVILLLVIENQPIPSQCTHSYGFHTARGRYLIETFQSYYYEHSENN